MVAVRDQKGEVIMSKWAELLVAGLIGAVVPAIAAVAYIGGLKEKVANLERNIEPLAKNAASDAIEKELSDSERISRNNPQFRETKP